MIFVKANMPYFTGRLEALLLRLENIKQPDRIPSPFYNETSVKSEIGRLLLIASETLAETDYLNLMAMFQKSVKSRFSSFECQTPRDFKNYYLKRIIP